METKRMTRLSATATLAALLLLAIVQGFGATSSTKSTKSSPKVATKSTVKPYHITAQNQFHFQSTKRPKAAARVARQQKSLADRHLLRGPGNKTEALNTLHAQAKTRLMRRPRRQQANPPPSGTLGFVSATQIPSGGYLDDTGNQVLMGSLGGATAFITVVENPSGSFWYSEVVANGDGTFAAPVLTTPVPNNENDPFFVVGDVNGDGNSDIIQADNPGTITVLLSNGDGTFTAASPITVTANSFTGGTLVTDATTTFLDIVFVDDATPSNIVTVAGNGDGTFAAPSTPVPLAPTGSAWGVGYNVIIMDFDGDGTVDVAENDENTDQQNVYLFATATTPYTGVALTTPDGIDDACTSTAGSLTGSTGSPAILEVNCDDRTVTVYDNAAGVFSGGLYYPTAITPTTNANIVPYSATIADVNGDGNGDVVVTNDYSGDVTILIGNGDGTLQQTSVGYATGGYPFTPAIVTDLNGDGLVDILVADEEFSLTWMAGFGDGTFQAARNYYGPVPDGGFDRGSESIASGDFNGDGFADVVVGNFDDTSVGVTVFLSNPDGSLQPGVNYGLGGTLSWVTVADFNGDGILDFAASDTNGGVIIFTGTGNGNFIQGPSYSTGGNFTEGIVAADFNQDGFTDLAVLNEGSTNVNVLLNNGTGGFTPQLPVTLAVDGENLAAADLNGDGNPDLAIAEADGSQVGVLLWDPTTSLLDIPETDVILLGPPLGIALSDVDGDGNVDIVATVPGFGGPGGIAVALGDGTGNFTPFAALITTSLQDPTFDVPIPYGIQVTDVNGDGIPDLVYTNAEFGTVGVLFGTGTGTVVAPGAPYFYDPVEFPSAQIPLAVTVANITGDGTPAVATANDRFVGASTMINANGPAAAPNFSLAVSGQTSPAFLNIPAGGTATAMITLTPVNFYSGTVTFSCGGLPLDVTCAFAPATLTPVGNAPLSTTLTVTTAAAHGALHMPADSNPHQGRTSLLACLTGMGLFGLLLSGDWKNKRNRRVGILLGILVLGMMFSLVGCSSSSTPGTPIGAQTIQVTGTGSDGTTNSVNLTINVF
jgi:hypothetical protein